MSKTRFTGPIVSKTGFRFVTSDHGNRPMTIVCTSYIRTDAASVAATLTQLCGLTRMVAGWGNVRMPAAARLATLNFVSVCPYGWGSTVTAQLLWNRGTGQRVGQTSGGATIDIFMLGYA